MKSQLSYLLLAIVASLALNVNSECWKTLYGRGAGEAALVCRTGYVRENGLCYPPCKSGYTGYGPVCAWTSCQGTMATSCGALCAENATQCASIKAKIEDELLDDAVATFELYQANKIGKAQTFISWGFSNLTQSLKKLELDKAYSTPGLYVAPTSQTLVYLATNEVLAIQLMFDECSKSSNVQTQCWKKTSEKQQGLCATGYTDSGAMCFSKCSGVNSVDCGAFCTNSKMNCAKMQTVFFVAPFYGFEVDTGYTYADLTVMKPPVLPKFDTVQQATAYLSAMVAAVPSNYLFQTC